MMRKGKEGGEGGRSRAYLMERKKAGQRAEGRRQRAEGRGQEEEERAEGPEGETGAERRVGGGVGLVRMYN